MVLLNACGDCVEVNEISSSKVMSSSSLAKSGSSKTLYPESFKPDDKEFPYAGIPRIVIETEYRQKIKDR